MVVLAMIMIVGVSVSQSVRFASPAPILLFVQQAPDVKEVQPIGVVGLS
jgi:hypothetical protein